MKVVIGVIPSESSDDALALGGLLCKAFDAQPVLLPRVLLFGNSLLGPEAGLEQCLQTHTVPPRARQSGLYHCC